LDQDLATSRKSIQGTKFPGKSNGGAEETNAGLEVAVNVFSSKSKGKAHHREHQQADKKKKKKKKQKQKEKLKAKDERALKLKVKSEEEVRREELQKAGVLPSANVLLKGNGKGEVFKEASNEKGSWTKTSEEHSKLHIKGKSLPILDSENTRDRNQNGAVNSDKERKGNEGKEWPIRTVHQYTHDNMSSLDSTIAYLSQPEQVLSHLTTSRLPISPDLGDVPQKHDWTESIKDNGLNADPMNAWSKPSEDWLRNKNRWFGSFSNADQDVTNSRMKPDQWIHIPSVSESAYRETGGSDLLGIHGFSRPVGKDASQDRQPHFSASAGKTVPEEILPRFSASVGKTVPDNRLPHFGASLGKDMPGNKAYTWKASQTNISGWPGLNPKEERRYFSGNSVYGSPNTRWSRFSVESLKHGNLAGNIKTVPELPIDQSKSWNRNGYNIDETSDNWPNFPLEAGTSIQRPIPYSWPKYSDEITNQNSITIGKTDAWSKPSLDPTVFKQQVVSNGWSQMQASHQKPLSAIDTAIAHNTKEASSNKQWPHFAYHRVTSSPQILAQQQKEAQQRASHRSAYIAVSVIAPPGKSKGLSKTQSRTNGSLLTAHNKMNELPTKLFATPFPDKMDQLLAMRSEKQKFPEEDNLLEEQLVDLAVAGQQQQQQQQGSVVPWSHARHLDKIQVFVSFGTLYSFCVLGVNFMRPCL
jgi:hypothetical protein